MPILPLNEFGEDNSVAPSPEYPNGAYKDETIPGTSNDGSPVTSVTPNDDLGFQEALYAEVGVTPTNVPDTALSSQRLDAIKLLILKKSSKVVTLSEAVSSTTASEGEYVTISDRGLALYEYVTGETANGIDIVNASSGLQLRVVGYSGNIIEIGAKQSIDLYSTVLRSIVLTNTVTLPQDSFSVNLSSPVDVPANVTIDLNVNSVQRFSGYTPNSKKVMFNHVGDNSKILNVLDDNIPADERLIGYTEGVQGCIEYGCNTGRGTNSLIRFEGVENTNVSNTLTTLASTKLREKPTVKVITSRVEIPASSGLTFKRTRHLPSECRIKNIKVTDENGSPNFSFSLAMRAGASFVYPFQRAVAASDINTPVDIDWFYDSFDDILSFEIDNQKASATVFNIEIQYLDGVMGRDDNAWAYQSILDFNRPHDYGAANILAAKRGVEYRSTPVGEPLDVRAAITTRSTFDNYGYPETTIPTPSGSQDLTESSELKFYFNFSAGMAMSTGATHLRFRLYQQTRQVKCTCINGFLSQKPDWSTGVGHLATSFQPDIEIDLNGATRDTPQEVLIPLDAKAMQNAVIEAEGQDLHYFYLTFFQNLPGHVPIEWGDVWEWECDFVRL